jgi:hypothetical protein
MLFYFNVLKGFKNTIFVNGIYCSRHDYVLPL